MNTIPAARYCNNEFAVFPFCRTWESIRECVERWDRAEGIQFLADRYETFLLFHFGGHGFCLYDHDATLRICVNDANCPREILAEVRDHFAAFLPSQPWGNDSDSAMWCD